MSYLLFMDESGCDRRESPYEVLAGVCVEDCDLWSLICDVQDKEEEFFGQRISSGLLELKGKKILKKKVFRHAALFPAFESGTRTFLANQCLQHKSCATPEEYAAMGQAKIAFVKCVFELCIQYNVRAFASIVDRDAERTERNFLRKDYSYLFERYYNFLENISEDARGLVVFDELERSQCHILIDQMSRYFRRTGRGLTRSSRIIPEPFFVHSHLTTAIQIADLVAYIVAWAVRISDMRAPTRPELKELADMVLRLRYRRMIRNGTDEYPQWSFVFINDLRPRDERIEAAE